MEANNITLDLITHGEATPDAPALIVPGREITYRELNLLTWQAAADLHDAGVRAGDVVALSFARDELSLAVAMLGVARLGATVYSLSRNATQAQRMEAVSRVEIALLVSDQEELFCPGIPGLHFACQLPVDGRHIDGSIARDDPDAPWLLISGSGTTGEPRLIPVSHRQQRARNQLVNHVLQVRPEDRSFHFSNLDFTSAKSRLCLVLSSGAAFGPIHAGFAKPVDFINEQRFTMVDITTFHVENLLASLPRDSENLLPGVRIMGMTSATVSDDLRQRIRRILCSNLCVVYGSNEMGIVTAAMPPEVYENSETVGTPPPGVEVQVIDPASKEPLPPGTIGQIRTRSPGQTDGYWESGKKESGQGENGQSPRPWFYPGDLGKFTAGGQLIHYGRADHMMIVNGINIYPAEIERVLLSHPAVQDVAAMPIRHQVHQDVPICAVALQTGVVETEAVLQAYAGERLGARCPKAVIILERIPRNEQGKLLRKELRELVVTALNRSKLPAGTGSNASGSRTVFAMRGQLPRAISFSFLMPAQPNLAGLDAWLFGVMGNDIEQKTEGDYPGRGKTPPMTRQWVWRCLQLVRLLLQATRIPVFDPPRVMSCELSDPDRRLWSVTAEFALVDDYPADIYRSAIIQAFNLAGWAATREPDGENRSVFFNTIQQRFLAPLAGRLPAGKSIFWVLRAAHSMGIPFRHLGGGVFLLGWGAKGKRLDRSSTELDSTMGARLSQNKVQSARLLRAAGLPAATHEVSDDADVAVDAARRLGWPVVLKPLDRDRGEGVTVDVVSEALLKTAFDHAQGLTRSRLVIVERQVEGVCHRLFIAHGKLLYGVKRLPMAVRGNGRQTVAELVADEYSAQQRRPPWQRTEISPLDALAIAAMASAGLSPSSVPDAGVFVPLRSIESTEWGGVDEDVTHVIHPENLRIALASAALFGLDVAGIDIISPDITRPWFENGAIINEVNFSPLLGGGEISLGHIPEFLADYVQGDGRIPVEVFVGGEAAWQAARERWQALLDEGVNCYLTSSQQTLEPSGERVTMAVDGLYQRTRALVLQGKVAAMVLAVQTDEFLDTGLPVEWIDGLTLVDDSLTSFTSVEGSLAVNRRKSLLRLLESWKMP